MDGIGAVLPRQATVMCTICDDTLWVCENHRDKPWDGLSDRSCDCGGAGEPCECNPDALMPPGFKVTCGWDDDGNFINRGPT